MSTLENIPPEKRGNPDWVKGGPSPNPGGKPKKLREIEELLDAEHRNVENMRKVFDRLRSLATEDIVRVYMAKDGQPVEDRQPPEPAFMKLYLERVIGPVKDVSDDRLEKLVKERLEAMLAEAEARRAMQ